MAKLPTRTLARNAIFTVFTLIGTVAIGAVPVAGAGVPTDLTPATVSSIDDSSQDPNQDPEPLVKDPPEVQGPSNPGQKTLTPQHHRSHHRAPTST